MNRDRVLTELVRLSEKRKQIIKSIELEVKSEQWLITSELTQRLMLVDAEIKGLMFALGAIDE